MIKIKILREAGSTKKKQKAANKPELNAIQKHNVNFLLQSNYSVTSKYSDPSVIENFIEDMANQNFEQTGNADIFDNTEDYLNPVTVVEELVREIRPLHNNKIVKAITGASFGKIFKLSNDHILKIFLGGVDVASDMDWFRKCFKLMHSGKAKRTTLPVYDFEWGEDLPMLPSYPEYKIGYVEMAEFEPLDDFLKRTGREESDTVLHQLKALFKMTQDEGLRDLKSIQKRIMEFAPDDSNLEPLTRNEAARIVEAFYDMTKMGFALSDVAPRNMAVLKQSDPADPTIIIFDR